jgi:hypothetical protein
LDAKNHIRRRAGELGCADCLPDDWHLGQKIATGGLRKW